MSHNPVELLVLTLEVMRLVFKTGDRLVSFRDGSNPSGSGGGSKVSDVAA